MAVFLVTYDLSASSWIYTADWTVAAPQMILLFVILGDSSHPAAAAAAKSLQSCPTLCDPIDGSPPGSPVPGILQARTLEWVASHPRP